MADAVTGTAESPTRSVTTSTCDSPLAMLRKVARRFGLLPRDDSEVGEVPEKMPPVSPKWWTLLPVEPFKYQRVVVFDTETSGFGADDEIIEIGAVELEVRPIKAESGSRNICSMLCPTGICFHSLVRASGPVNANASQVNGLDFNTLQVASPKPEAIRRFMKFIGDEKTALIAHNAAFDLRMLLQDLKRCGLEAEGIRLGQRCFCSAAAFGAFRPSGARDLTTACYLLDIPEGSPGSVWRSTHSALVDAVLTAKVVLAILSKVAIEEGRTVPGAASLSLPCRLSTPARLPETDAREQRGQKRRLPNSFATRAE